MTEQYQAYFSESDPEKRKKLLDAIEEADGQTPALELCRKLWRLRYEDPKSKRRVDLFLWEILELLCLYGTARIMKKSAKKDTEKALKALGISLASDYGQEGEQILQEELRNTVRLYLKTCESKSYGRRLFGLTELKDQDRPARIAKDMWRLSMGLPQRLQMTEEFAPLAKAVREEFCSQYADGEALLQKKEEEGNGGKNQKQ